MSQNFSKMSDIYIPELMELDSYWQKAVEDAICDTLKGEKRLYYALRNRKKIKEKLELLGLKTTNTQLSISTLSQIRMGSETGHGSMEEKEESESSSESSVEGAPETRPEKKRSHSHRTEERSPDNRHKNPDRPLLGSGSLEKMKKSHNSFNCEPMGFDKKNPDHSDTENEDRVIFKEFPRKGELLLENNKTVEWLHVRNDSDFDCSEPESITNDRDNYFIPDKAYEKRRTVKDKNYFIIKKDNRRLPKKTKAIKGPSAESPWGTSSEETIGYDPDLERRLQLALAKRDILNENLKTTSLGNNRAEIEIQGAPVRLPEKRRRGDHLLSPFIRFYLEVYREQCQKCSAREIGEEAARRWRTLSAEEKLVFAEKKFSKLSF